MVDRVGPLECSKVSERVTALLLTGRGRDDSETSGRRLSGPYGGRNSGSRVPGKIRDSLVKPRAPAVGADSSSSLCLRLPRFLGGGSRPFSLSSSEPQLREHDDHVPSESEWHEQI